MFSWWIHASWSANRFELTVPMHYIGLLVSIPALLTVVVWLQNSATWLKVAIAAAVLLVVGMFIQSSTLTLDRENHTATVWEFQFFHWTTTQYPLSQVSRVYEATGNTNSQLRVQFADGSERPLSLMDDTGGKAKVAFEAMQFLAGQRGENMEGGNVAP